MLNVSVASDAPASLTNIATVSGGGESNTGNNGSAVTFNVAAVPPDLTLTKSALGPFVRGGSGQFTLTVGNAGSGPSNGVITVTDPLPGGMTLTAVTASGWNCIGSTTVTCTTSSSIPPGGSSTIALTVSIPAGIAASVTNQATVSGGGEINTANNQSSAVVTILTPVSISVPAGVSFTFNGQLYSASQVINVPPGSYVLSTTTPQTLAAGTRAVFESWSNGGAIAQNLAVGTTALTITGAFRTQFLLTVNATQGGTATPASGFLDAGSVASLQATPANGFTFANWTGDPVVAPASPATTIAMDAPKTVTANFTAVTLVPDLTVAAVYTGNFVQARTSPFVLRVRNAGGAPTSSAYSVDYFIPDGLALGEPAPAGSGWTCTLPQANLLRCSRALALEPGAIAPDLLVHVTPAATAPASVLNRFTVAGGGETNLANNTAQNTVIVERVITVTVPAGVAFSLNNVNYTGPQVLTLPAGSYPLATTSPQQLAPGTRALFQSWSNGGALAHTLTVGASALNITGNFTLQHLLTTSAGPGGSVTPSSGQFYDAGSQVPLTATPAAGFVFSSWSGPVANATLASTTVTMAGPVSVAAAFTAGAAPAPNVTSQFTITLGAPATNRVTGRFVQNVTVRNNGAALASAAFVLDNLAPMYAVFQPAGQTVAAAPAGSPFREVGPVAAGATVTFTVEFTRSAVGTLTYTPRLLGVGAR